MRKGRSYQLDCPLISGCLLGRNRPQRGKHLFLSFQKIWSIANPTINGPEKDSFGHNPFKIVLMINLSLKICAGGEGKDACDGEGGAPLVCLDKVRYYFFLAATSYLTIWCFCFCSKLFLQTRDQYFVVGLVNYGFTCSGILFHEQDFDCYCKSWFPCQSLTGKTQ